MRIKEIKSQTRRDFTAIYICEHCRHEVEGYGYDDDHFHRCVIPNMVCKKCGNKSPDNYRPLTTKYKDSEVV